VAKSSNRRRGVTSTCTCWPCLASAADLAERAGGLSARYVREWALAQSANGFIDYEPASQTFNMTPEQAMIFALKDSPAYLAGAYDLAAAMIEGEAKVESDWPVRHTLHSYRHPGALRRFQRKPASRSGRPASNRTDGEIFVRNACSRESRRRRRSR